MAVDSGHHPEGYNIGIDDGTAAGQIVPKIHSIGFLSLLMMRSILEEVPAGPSLARPITLAKSLTEPHVAA